MDVSFFHKFIYQFSMMNEMNDFFVLLNDIINNNIRLELVNIDIYLLEIHININSKSINHCISFN